MPRSWGPRRKYSTSSRSSGLLFDSDYALADSSRGVVDCVEYAFERLPPPSLGTERIYRTAGVSLSETLVAPAGSQRADKIKAFEGFFREPTRAVMTRNTEWKVLEAEEPAAVFGNLADLLGMVQT